MSRHKTHLTAVTDNLQVGNALARLIGLGEGDALTFTKGVPLRAIGGDGTVVAWAATVLLTDRGAELVSEFNGDGPWPLLAGYGASEGLILAGKAHVQCELSVRGEERSAISVYADLGYEPARDDSVNLPKPDRLAALEAG